MKALSQPLFASLRGYDRQQLGPDLFSGVLIALLSIPISMGYAQLAGLPPVYGLYGSLIPILLFAMLSTTREFIFGVDAAPAAMIGAVLASLGVTAGSAEAMRIVPVLTLYVALWLAVFALVRADRAVDYISEPVMGGFISGVCCEIILMQVPKLLGSGTGTGELFELLGHIFDAAKTVNLPTAALGFGTLAILLLAPRKWPKVPWVLVMMVLGGLLGAFAPLADRGVALLAAVPRGLPKPVLPDLTALPFTEALVATLPVAAVILAETLLASSGTAQKNGYRLNGRREIAAYAVCNVAAGLVGCCVVSGSVSRTAVNERNGGKTQLVSVTASVTMLLVLLFATPLIRFLPVPVLTAIVVNALIGATEFGIARRLWRVNRVELGIFAGAFLGVLLLGAIKGVLVGMVLSFVDVLMRAAAPQRTFLGTLPGKSGFFPIDRVSGVQPLPRIVLYRFSGSLFFANIRRFQEDIEGALQPDTQAVIVDGSAVVSVDITACDRLVALNRKLRAQGVRFYLTEHIGEVNDQLRHFEAGELIETGAVRRTIRGALRDAGVTLEYAGYAGQQIKQADVNLLGYPLGVVTDRGLLLRDLAYYDAKIDRVNGPAMAFSVFCVQYAWLGDAAKAEEMFRRCYRPNLRPPFGVLAETPTSHNPYFTTCAGGMLQAVMNGFGGLEITDKGIVCRETALPASWKRLTIKGVGPERRTYVINNP